MKKLRKKITKRILISERKIMAGRRKRVSAKSLQSRVNVPLLLNFAEPVSKSNADLFTVGARNKLSTTLVAKNFQQEMFERDLRVRGDLNSRSVFAKEVRSEVKRKIIIFRHRKTKRAFIEMISNPLFRDNLRILVIGINKGVQFREELELALDSLIHFDPRSKVEQSGGKYFISFSQLVQLHDEAVKHGISSSAVAYLGQRLSEFKRAFML